MVEGLSFMGFPFYVVVAEALSAAAVRESCAFLQFALARMISSPRVDGAAEQRYVTVSHEGAANCGVMIVHIRIVKR